MAKAVANQLKPSQVSGRLATWHRVMEEAGLTYSDLQKPIDDPKMRKRLVIFWRSGGFEAATSQKRAREIMGNNFFGVEEAIIHFGLKPSRQQLAVLRDIPFSDEKLESLKNTHILVAVFPLSIRKIIKICHKKKQRLFYHCLTKEETYFYYLDFLWYRKESFVKEKGDIGWQLIPISDMSQSVIETDKSAQMVVYSFIVYYFATGKRPLGNPCIRTSSLDSLDSPIHINFGLNGIDINSLKHSANPTRYELDHDWDID